MDLKFKIKYAWNKVFWFFGRPTRYVYSFLVRPHRQAAKVLIIRDLKILLVRPNYGHRQWSVPGGGIEKGESGEDGARRELREELAMTVETIRPVGSYQH